MWRGPAGPGGPRGGAAHCCSYDSLDSLGLLCDLGWLVNTKHPDWSDA